MEKNIVASGMKVSELIQSLQELLEAGSIQQDMFVVLDTHDGFRHGIKEFYCENREVVTLNALLHDES